MATNYLKLNEDKTEIVVVSNKTQSADIQISSINIGGSDIVPSKSARNLGVIFYSALAMEQHISAACKKAWFELRKISRIRKYLIDKAAMTLAHAFVTSKVDYCNIYFYMVYLTNCIRSCNMYSMLQRE